MKNIFKYLFVVLAAGLAAVSCKPEEFQAGEQDLENCYGVYFTKGALNFSYAPEETKTCTVGLKRTKTEGAIDVPVTLTDEAGVFTATSLSFADGAEDGSITLTFPSIESGKTYTAYLSIDDPAYASKYSKELTSISVSVLCESWTELEGDATITDNYCLGDTFTAKMERNDQKPNLYRLVDPFKNATKTSPSTAKPDGDHYMYLKVIQSGETVSGQEVNASDLVYFYGDGSPLINLGYYNTRYSADMNLLFPGSMTATAAVSYWSYNKVLSYQTKGTDETYAKPAVIQLAPWYYMNGVGGINQTQNAGVFTIVFPGVVLVDYSVEMKADEFSENGAISVKFEFGDDVDSFKYQVYEGKMNNKVAGETAAGLKEDSNAKTATITAGKAAVSISGLEKTGVYTVVAAAYDDKGNYQEFAQLAFNYVKSGDNTKDVVAGYDLYATNRWKAVDEYYDDSGVLEFYVYGGTKELPIVDAKIGFFKKAEYTADADKCKKALESVSDEVLAAINGTGYVGYYPNLLPGTDYTLVMVLANEFTKKEVVLNAATEAGTVAVDNIVGVYTVSQKSTLGDKKTSTSTLTLEKSDNDTKGNVMLTVFDGKACDEGTPIYGTFTPSTMELSFDSDQTCMVKKTFDTDGTTVKYTDTYKFKVNDETATKVTFHFTGRNVFGTPSVPFGLFIETTNTAEDAKKGWDSSYNEFTATWKSKLPEKPATPAPAAVQSFVSAPRASQAFFDGGEREVKVASYTAE